MNNQFLVGFKTEPNAKDKLSALLSPVSYEHNRVVVYTGKAQENVE